MNNIKIVFKEPFKKAEERIVEDRLEEYQKLVEGYFETVRISENICILCNEEGKLKELDPNIIWGDDVVAGNIFVVGVQDADFRSLTENEIKVVKEILNFAAIKTIFD